MYPEQLSKRKTGALFLSCTAVFVALFVINFLDCVKKVQANSYVEWDVKTITAGDYTVEFQLDETFFQDYIDKEMAGWIEKSALQNRKYLSKLQSFQFWLQCQMEERLNQTPTLGFDEDDDAPIKVAVTTLAFKNAQIIELLTERGNYIKSEQWDKMREVTSKINEIKK